MTSVLQRLQAAAWQKQPAAQTHVPVEPPLKQTNLDTITTSAEPEAPRGPLVSAHELSMLADSYLARAPRERALAPTTAQQSGATAFPPLASRCAPAPVAACSQSSQPPVRDTSEAVSAPTGASAGSPVDRLWVALGKDPANDSHFVVKREILSNLQLVRSLAPQLLTDFAKMDGGSGKITAEQLKRYSSA